MGARPSSFKKGGGFLNNVDAVIAGYHFTDEFPGQDGKSQKSGNSDFNPLFSTVSFDVDGDDEQKSQSLMAGSADDFEISDDGLTLTLVEEKNGLRENTPWATFVGSLVDAGFPETNLPDDDEPINYEAIIGTRVRLVQIKDEQGMARAAKKWKTSKGKFNEQGQKKGKDGKYYNLTLLTVAEVYEIPSDDEKPAPKGAKGAKTSGKPAPAGRSKKADPLEEEAVETLLAILSDADGSIAKSKLPNKLATKLGAKHPKREELRRLIYSDEFLSQEGKGWSYDPSSKQQTITKDEEE